MRVYKGEAVNLKDQLAHTLSSATHRVSSDPNARVYARTPRVLPRMFNE